MKLTQSRPNSFSSNSFRRSLRILNHYLFPLSCFHCNASLGAHQIYPICSSCFTHVQLNKPPFCKHCGRHVSGMCDCPESESKNCTEFIDSIFFMLTYYKVVRKMIQKLKIQNSVELLPLLSQCCSIYIKLCALKKYGFDAIVPIPQSTMLFNNKESLSLIFAKLVQKKLNIPLYDIIRKKVQSKKQSLLSKTKRITNVKNAFRLKKRPLDHIKKVLLVDDVLTTGATANECSKILRISGVPNVCILAIARGR